MNYQRIQLPGAVNYNLAYFVTKIKSNKKAIGLTIVALVGILIIAAILKANRKAEVKVANSKFIDQFDQRIETLITGQNDPKGQIISKCPFWCLQIIQKTNEFFSRISALTSKKMLSKKNKGTLYHWMEIFILTLLHYIFDLTSF